LLAGLTQQHFNDVKLVTFQLKPGYAVTAVEENHGARGKIESNEPTLLC
jgi:hypothetical protein